ncbi:hypothetical protein [Gordonia rubripertincta]|uniref:hypothetical protein n=1 Tax=Gordonia rubripertincta TaxID=36822 RepID=UPI0015FA200A|nr:hypothetical protein [Gordonia rubripertincta]QMU22047.1 hypothetical protein H3V45_06030 [Gordonia rubripertincta]
MSTYTPREGDVVRYRSERDNSWCREGMAIATKRSWDKDVVLIDTFWGHSSPEDHILTRGEIATAELLFNLADYDEVGRSRKAPPAEWERRAEADRQIITQQHRLQNRWFIRKGSTEDRDTIIGNARTRLTEAESELESARRRVEWAREDLARAENVECEHIWQLVEDGYGRFWSTTIDDERKVIVARDSQMSDDGDGEYLSCENCQERRDVPTGYTIGWY